MSPQALAELLQQSSSSSDTPPAYASLYPALYATKASTEPYIVSLEYPEDNEPLPCTSYPRFSNDMGAYPGPPFYVVTFENDYEITPPASVSESPFTAPTPKQTNFCTTLRSRRGLVILIPLLLLVISIFITLTVIFTRHHPTN
uniref:UDENN domain-containing protein n=1 Tax=Panagrellus redivivus TaxID=6233 RepID=A0A7E4UT15_PANRE